MKLISMIVILLSWPNFLVAEEGMSPEEYFFNGTSLLKPNSELFNPDKGLRYMLLAADKKYEHAPFGLCVALSIEKAILDLEHAYAWCFVAGKIGNKYSYQANRRLAKVGESIKQSGGAGALAKAKERAVVTYGM